MAVKRRVICLHIHTKLVSVCSVLFCALTRLTPDHLSPLSAEITNISHESAQKLLDATTESMHIRMDRSQKQGERHLTPTKQDYNYTENADFEIAEHSLLGIMGHYRMKEKDIQAKFTAKRPTNSQIWSCDLTHHQTEDQELRSRSHSNSCN